MRRTKTVARKHSLAIRWFHWVNFPILACMIWSGLLIYWANDVYHIGPGNRPWFHFFPEGFYRALHIPYHLAEGMSWHFAVMWLFFVNGLLYASYTLLSGEWRQLLPNRNSAREALQVLLHDLHLRKTAPPQGKYNGAQRIAYTAIILMGFGSLITGLAIFKPVQFSFLAAACGGYEAARLEHFILTIGYVLFFLIHIFQVLRAGWNNFQSMVTGWELIRDTKNEIDD